MKTEKLLIALPEGCREIMERIRLAGGESYAVGGAVRDALLGRPAGDFDVTTSFVPEEIMALFQDKKLIPTGKNFGTVGVEAEGDIFEVTTFRKDGNYSDFRRPDQVTFSKDIKEDLARRDFTVNAMAWSEETGLIDPFGGRKDLENRVLRAVGDPEKRFSEDALRIMRLLRFASQLGFVIDHRTGEAARSTKELLNAVSGERLSVELEKLLKGPSAMKVIGEYKEVLESFLGEITLPRKLTGAYHTDLAFLFEKQDGKALKTALERLKVSKKTRELALFVRENLAYPVPTNRIGLRLLLKAAGEEKARTLLSALAPEKLSELEDVIQNDVWSYKSLTVRGNDLGTEGEKTGEALDYLLDACIRERVKNDRESLIAYLKKGKRL